MTENSNRSVTTRSATENLQNINVILADSQAIFRVGISKIIGAEPDIRVVAQAESLGETLAAVSSHSGDLLLFEARISPTPIEAVAEIVKRDPQLKLVIMTPEASEDETVAYMRYGVRGIISRAITPDLLVRCIRRVYAGETWLDNEKVNWVMEAYRAQAAQLKTSGSKTHLNEKELLIISGVTQGLRNKDIAQEIGTTEQVVKNYLRKIYDKLNISDRLELALYCVHHRILDGPAAQIESQSRLGVAAATAPSGHPVVLAPRE
jgi:two-component system, NarL family, nitrate/nitrite response regulator NarL